MTDASRPATLAETGLETTALFKKIKRTDQNEHNQEWPSALFAAESDRFDLWAVNLGLFVSGHGSLDYRIREAESLERTIHRFMKDLNDSLHEVLEYRTGEFREPENDGQKDAPARSFDDLLDEKLEEESDQELESDLDLLLDGVRDPIDRLYKLSTRIRNPSSRLGSSKALRLQQVDPDSGVDLLHAFEVFDYDFASSLFLQYRKSKALDERQILEPYGKELERDADNHVWEPIRSLLSQYQDHVSAGTESFLVRRLARANVRRRQQFAYWKRHRDKLSHHTRTFTQNIEIGEDLTTFVVDPKMLSTDAEMPIAPVVHSVTTASRLNIVQLVDRDDQSTVSVSEYAPSTWRPGKEIIDFPPPPKQGPDEKFFECPYCFTLCSTDLLNERAWKAHLIHDLRPYICTYESCKNPDQLYDNRRDWTQHENSSHRKVWRCPEHRDHDFFRLEEYREHLHNKHPEHNEESLLRQLTHSAESNLSTSDRSCPICELSFGDPKLLHGHIAFHLERFSLFSLPRSAGDDDTTSNTGGSDQANIAFEGSRDDDFDSELGSSFLGEGNVESKITETLAASTKYRTLDNEESRERLGVLLGHWVEPDESTALVSGDFYSDGIFRIQADKALHRNGQTFWSRKRWLEPDMVIYEPRLQSLGFQEIQEYCRIRKQEMEKEESREMREANELKAIVLAKNLVAAQKLSSSGQFATEEEETPFNPLTTDNADVHSRSTEIERTNKSPRSMDEIARAIAHALIGLEGMPDKEPLSEILPTLTHQEFLDLRVRYKKIVRSGEKGVNIAKHIRIRLKGEDPSFMRACLACALGKWESEAYWASFWYQGEKVRRELLIESLLGRTNHEIGQIKYGFSDKKYDDSLAVCMKMELKEDKFKKAILLALEERRMEDDTKLDQDLVKSDIEQLHDAVKREKGGETAMIDIIIVRNDTHLREILKTYEHVYHANFAREMLKKSSNLVGELLAHILNGVINKPVRDSLLLHHALSLSKSDSIRSELLISRLVRYHWDWNHMMAIKRDFKLRYSVDLRVAVSEGTSGEWGTFCERLCDPPATTYSKFTGGQVNQDPKI